MTASPRTSARPRRIRGSLWVACLAFGAGLGSDPATAAVPSPTNSSVDACLVACPAGDIGDFRVTVRDFANNPIAGADVWIDFGACTGSTHCGTAGAPPLPYVLDAGAAHVTSDAAGVARFPSLRLGGICRSEGIKVYASGVFLAGRALASPDQDGDLDVDAADSTLLAAKVGQPDSTADLNCDGWVSSTDVTFLRGHLGHACPQAIGWPQYGVPVATGTPSQSPSSAAPDGSGGILIAWNDQRNGSTDVYAQRLTADGTPRWGAQGVPVCVATRVQQDARIVSDGQGGAIVAWKDDRAGVSQDDIYVQRLSAAGVPQWAKDGVALCTATSIQFSPRLASDGAGGAIVAWLDYRGGPTNPDVYARRVSASGVPQWAADGVVVSSSAGQKDLALVADGQGGVVVAWVDTTGDVGVHANRVSASGSLQWGAGGVLAYSGSADDPAIVVGPSGFIVGWWSPGSIRAQRLDLNGNLPWGAGGAAVFGCCGPVDRPALAADGSGGAILTWDNGAASDNDVFAQRIDSLGARQWGSSPVKVASGSGDQSNPALVLRAAGGAIVCWDDSRNGTSDRDLYAQALDGSGIAQWAANGVRFTAPGSSQRSPVMVSDGENGALVAWAHEVTGANRDIYAQRLTDPPAITRIEPNLGGNDGPVSTVVVGSGFQSGASARLARAGHADILGTDVVVAPDGRSLAAVFDLAGAEQGAWDVEIANPDLSGAALPNGFTIEAAAPERLRVGLIGPALMRPNRPKAFDVILENRGNSDALAVPLWITRIPETATVETDFVITPPPQEGGEPDWSQAPLTLSGPGGRYLPLVIPRLPPGVSVRRLYLTVPSSVASFELDASLAPPWRNQPAFRACLSGTGVISNPTCMGSRLAAIDAYLAGTPGIEALSGIGLWAKIAWQCEGAASLPAALVEAEEVLDLMLQPIEATGVPAGCAEVLSPEWRQTLVVGVVTSVDPNDKLGDGGFEASIAGDQTLSYEIRFENADNASAPTQIMVVKDTLDAATLDFDTVRLRRISFGRRAGGGQLQWSVDPPPGQDSYSQDLDLMAQQGVTARVEVSFDRATGILVWSIASFDSNGLSPPDDPLLGFLPPNVSAPEGEGSLLFTVSPRSGLTSGASIRNRATIVFDGDPTLTPEWRNTMDNTPPQSRVLPLAAIQDSASFTLRWEAEGEHPDLMDFSVYVSEDGGAYRLWRGNTTATADTFAGHAGRHYAFYSVAIDSLLNQEAPPGAPDAETFSRVAVGEVGPWALALEGARPNPAVGSVRVWFTLPNRDRATLEVMDVAGRRLARREVGQLGPGRHMVDLSAAARRPGLYFLRLAQDGQVLQARMAVIR